MNLSMTPLLACAARSMQPWKRRRSCAVSAGVILSLARVKPTRSTNMTAAIWLCPDKAALSEACRPAAVSGET